jgi:uncharacterized protein YkwD
MSLNFNWVDVVIVFAIFFFALEAYGRKLVIELLDLASFLLALILSFRYYNYLASIFETQFNLPHGLSLVIGFMVTWFLAETIFFTGARYLLGHHVFKLKIPYEKFLAIVPALLRGLIFLSLVLVLVATFPIQPKIKKAVYDSKIAPILLKQAYQLEEPVKQVFGGVTQDTLTFLTIKPRTDESVNLGFQTSEYQVNESLEARMIDLVNRERRERGLNTLEFDPKLREVGRIHSGDMFERGYFSHYSPEGEDVSDRAEKNKVEYMIIGENLAYAPTLELAHKGLMNSEGHRANILSPDFNKIGIGVMDGGVYGIMFTQIFSD